MSCGCETQTTCDPICPKICWDFDSRITVSGIITKQVSGDPCDQKINLHVECCDYEDKLVAVSPDCEPDYLGNQIEAESGSPIVVYVEDCKVKIGFNPDLNPDFDNKVAVDSTCPAGFLEDQVLGGPGISIIKVGCKLEWSINKTDQIRKKPKARLTLDITYDNSTIPDGNEGGTDITGLSVILTNDPAMVVVPNRITITKTGYYDVSFNGVVEHNDAMHAYRIATLCTNATLNDCAKDKISGGRTSGSFTGGLAMSIPGMSNGVSGTNLVYMTVGDVIRPAIRWSCTVTDVKFNTSGQIVIVGNNGSSITPPLPATTTGGFSFMVEYTDTF